jgi:serine/threonine protein kinase
MLTILITESGHAKIADFGIAKLNLAHFTVPGKVLGTPAYMAPEQLSGEGADGRSDLFSLGVILYAMVTGHSPFQGNSATTVCFKVANREPLPASALDMHIPPELDAVISHAMAKDPEQRYQRGLEFASDLKLLQSRLNPGTSTSSSLLAVTRNGSHATAQKKDLTGEPAVGAAYGIKLAKAILQKAPVRDLILGAATITLLTIAAVQSKLLFTSGDRSGESAVGASQMHANAADSALSQSASAAATPGVPVTEVPPPKKPTVRKTAAKTPSKPSKGPANEVVVPSCAVDLTIRHQFKDATLTVWVDDALTLTRPLHGAAQKRLVVFNGVRGFESETIKVPAGKHVLKLKTESADHTVNLSKAITADFVGGADRTLEITFDKHNTAMRVAWQ